MIRMHVRDYLTALTFGLGAWCCRPQILKAIKTEKYSSRERLAMNTEKYEYSRSLMAKQQEAGSTIIVTGAGGGIGGSIVKRLLSDGWPILAVDISRESLGILECENSVSKLLDCSAMDVSSADDVKRVALELQGKGIKVAGLVNAAGILQDAIPFMDLDLFLQKKIWDVNYFGAVYCTKWFGKLIMENGGGSIVNITSINEARVLPLHAYGPTKVALGSLTTLTAGELGEYGVRVNSVAPGFTLTPAFREKISSGKRDISVLESAAALGRMVEMDEVASVVSFLLSDESSAITGASIPVDAGWLTTSHWMNFKDLLRNSG